MRIQPSKLLIALFTVLALFQSEPVHAQGNGKIVLRAAGSGAVLGLAAGLITYPFASGASTLIAGVVVGALAGTWYGFHLVDERDKAYEAERAARMPQALFELRQIENLGVAYARNGKARASLEVSVPFAVFSF